MFTSFYRISGTLLNFFILLEKKQVNSPNLGVMVEQRGAVASTIPVKRLINNGAP